MNQDLEQPQEFSVDVTNTLRIMKLDRVFFIQERNGIGWITLARCDGPTAYKDSHVELARYSRENQARLAAERAGMRLPAKEV